ncbi:MAG: glycoside hydrolase family 3 C-terminal domain-containing protein [Kiritimatiellae bacterium]|nr:glycoside hydrolase family 3 C-terminal domain-containing protein [Kiritimatiellia bacterium]
MMAEEFAVTLAADGIVLLENKGGVLPLRKGEKAVLLGFTGYYPHRMGWGSGDMLLKTPVPYDRGLEEAGVDLDRGVAGFYRTVRERRLSRGTYARLNRDWGKWTSRFSEPFLWRMRLSSTVRTIPRGTKCIVTIGRNAGEMADLSDRPGSFRLHREERALLSFACRRFENVIVLLNAAGVVDTSFMDEFPVKALVFTSLLGEVSGTAVAKILTGEINPSGRTVDTWAKRYSDYPSSADFGGRVSVYSEGCDVGYRHFAKADIVPRYPFGHGLSYTTFSEEPSGDGVKVTNTGSARGARAVLRWEDGMLSGFAKTRVLEPGESETVRFPDAAAPKAPDLPAGKTKAIAESLSSAELVSIVNGATQEKSPFAGEFWCAPEKGVPRTACADGPSGVRLARFGADESEISPVAREMFAWPCATAIAQGWNERAAETFGRFIAADLSRAGIDGWLGPAVNIHRNPLCGRNFEYFSEDPLLSGKMGAAVIRGVQTGEDGSPSWHWATLKHLCANNQESFRDVGDSIVGEDALREIYLRPFEIAVKEGRPLAVMTAYNRLNGEPCATSRRLLTDILRGEWGFEGVVMSDWWTVSDKLQHFAAGSDLVMPGVPDDRETMLKAVADGSLDRALLERSAARIIGLALLRG